MCNGSLRIFLLLSCTGRRYGFVLNFCVLWLIEEHTNNWGSLARLHTDKGSTPSFPKPPYARIDLPWPGEHQSLVSRLILAPCFFTS
jgi:hypothetical protein